VFSGRVCLQVISDVGHCCQSLLTRYSSHMVSTHGQYTWSVLVYIPVTTLLTMSS